MSAQQGGNDNMAVVESFKEALKQRIGADHFQMWFSHGVTIAVEDATQSSQSGETGELRVLVQVRGQFALDRLRKNFIRELRAAARAGCGARATVSLQLDSTEAVQAELPLEPIDAGHIDAGPIDAGPIDAGPIDQPISRDATNPHRDSRRAKIGRGRRTARPLSHLISETATVSRSRGSADRNPSPTQLDLPNLKPGRSEREPSAGEGSGTTAVERRDGRAEPMTAASFVVGSSNQLAHTAMVMAIQSPQSASPLFVCGPTGTGKTHLLTAIAQQFRSRHRMRRVIHLSAEQFTNDFITSVGNSGIASFRRRYREVDALLIDDVQFLGAKRATLREMLYTVETLISSGRPMVFSGDQAPTEIPGLSRELAGRMAAGLLCPIQKLDQATRKTLLRRALDQRCSIEVPEQTVEAINSMLAGDGRVISGVVNLINTLQRMFTRMPTIDEIRRFGGDLLRASKPVANLSTIEQAVCQTFHLPDDSLRASSQTRAVSEPRMLAMHLSRQLTSAAFAEIGGHYGGRSHSTAIAARKNVDKWLKDGKSIGRGLAAMSVQDAIDRVESLLRSG
jgi:chromosomal replication initiator protein